MLRSVPDPDELVNVVRGIGEADMVRRLHRAPQFGTLALDDEITARIKRRADESRICPRCGGTIKPETAGPSFDHPAGQRVIETYGDDRHCGACEFDAEKFSPINREVLS